MNTFKYFLYLRKSTDREDMQVLSIDGQRAECEKLATSNNLSIVETLIEHQSAKMPGRPVYDKMLARLEAGEADGIIAYHPNRLARNSKDGGELIYWLDIGKVKDLRFPTFWFANDPQGKAMLGIEFAQSKRFTDDLSVVTRRGLEQKCRRGEFPGRAPRGYLNDRNSQTIQVDLQLAPVIRQMFERYAAGTETVESLRIFLADHHVLSKPTKRFHGQNPIDDVSVRSMLSNPIYYGSFRFAGILYDGKHKPIISKNLFDSVQQMLTYRSPAIKSPAAPKAFTKLVRCYECSMFITAETQKSHTYYRCSRKSRVIACMSPFVREEEFERLVSNLLMRYVLPVSVLDGLTDLLENDEKNFKDEREAFDEDLLQKQRRIGEKLNLLADAYLNQEIDRATYVRKQNELVSERSTLKQVRAEANKGRLHGLELVRKWINTARNIAKIAQNGSQNEKRQLAVEIFGSNLRLDGKNLRGEAVKSWSSVPEISRWRKQECLYAEVRHALVGL
jgi:site-specific DNA recombinase